MSEATIRWVGGPVLYARTQGEFRVGEALEVGPQRRPGEVIRLKGDELVGQVYEDTTGLKPGDAVNGTGAGLSVRLGPGLLGRIFDGLLRPLDEDANSEFAFKPLVKTGDELTPGMPIGELPGDGIQQRILCPPDVERHSREHRRRRQPSRRRHALHRQEPPTATPRTSASSSAGRSARRGRSPDACPPTRP